MKEIKSVGDNTIYEKKSGRYAVKDANKKFVNGDDKAKILADAGLITIPEPKAAPAEEMEEASEQAAEEAPASEQATEE